MNSSFVNGISINGVALPNWVVRAVVVGTAAAAFSVTPTRITYASALTNAGAVVTLTETHIIAARATGYAAAVVTVQPTLKYAGNSLATATATGNGAVRRDVFATAGGDATCTGLALTAQAIGTASTSMGASVVQANAHIVFPGRSNTVGLASASAAGDVKRYPSVVAGIASAIYARAEPSVKLSGHSYFNHDGYTNATSGATATVSQAGTKLSVTRPTTATAGATSSCRAFVTYPARSTGLGSALNAQSLADARQSKFGSVSATGVATASATPTRQRNGQVAGTAFASTYIIRANVDYKASSTVQFGLAAGLPADSLRKAYALCSGSIATSYLVESSYGNQYFADLTATAESSGYADSLQMFAGSAIGGGVAVNANPITGTQYRATSFATAESIATPAQSLVKYAASASSNAIATLVRAPFGTQHFGDVSGTSQATSSPVKFLTNYAGHVSASSEATLVSTKFGTQHFADAVALCEATSNKVVSWRILMGDTAPLVDILVGGGNGLINGPGGSYIQTVISPVVMATALVGRAYAIANSDVKAPDGRYITVPPEDRVMSIQYENRTMVVTV